jgi:cobalamin biosynthesis protein CobT
MKNRTSFFLFLSLISSTSLYAQPEEKIEIPPAVIKKMERLQNGDLNKLEKIKLADDLQRAGAKSEALALYEENLPMGQISGDIPPEAYLNYGTALLEKGEEQKGLAVYDTLSSSLDPKNSKSEKIKQMLEKNVMNYFRTQEQKKEQEKKDKKDQKENKDNQQGQSGSGSEQQNQSGSNPKDQKDKKGQGDKPEDKQDKKDGKGEEKEQDKKESDKDQEEKDKKDQENKDNEGEKSKLPPPKMPPKLKQLMSDDRQLQMKVIEQGTRDMNRRQNRENKDW